MIVLIVGVLVIGVAMSSRDERRAARERLRPLSRRLWPVAAVLWFALLEPWKWG